MADQPFSELKSARLTSPISDQVPPLQEPESSFVVPPTIRNTEIPQLQEYDSCFETTLKRPQVPPLQECD